MGGEGGVEVEVVVVVADKNVVWWWLVCVESRCAKAQPTNTNKEQTPQKQSQKQGLARVPGSEETFVLLSCGGVYESADGYSQWTADEQQTERRKQAEKEVSAAAAAVASDKNQEAGSLEKGDAVVVVVVVVVGCITFVCGMEGTRYGNVQEGHRRIEGKRERARISCPLE